METQAATFIFQFVVLVFSGVLHEVAHGSVAEKLGDPTARNAGRITLNPMAHVSLFGMVIMPILTYLAWGIPVGGAKPVPYNPHNLRDPRRGGGIIALAGPLTNFLIAVVFGVFIRVAAATGSLPATVIFSFAIIVYINLLLGLFNLVPIPPLDGSKVVYLVLPERMRIALEQFSYRTSLMIRNNWVLFLVVIFFSFQYVLTGVLGIIDPVLNFLFTILTGTTL